MNSKTEVQEFVAEKTLALVGASRGGKKFGNTILKEMQTKGYTMYPVHPEAEEIDGVRCVPSLQDLPEDVGGVVFVVKPGVTEQLVREVKEAGISRVWMQQGAASDQAIAYCREQGIDVVANECLLMFSEPVQGIHGFHRWLWNIFGKLPR